MAQIDLHCEQLAAEIRLWHRPALEWFRRQGFDPASLLHTAPGLGLSRVEWSGCFWQPVEGGQPAIVVPIWIVPPVTLPEGGRTAGVIEDLAAVDPSTGTIALRRGQAWALGQHLVDGEEREPRLRCFLDPRDWLRAGGDGVLPIDWRTFTSRVSGQPRISLLFETLPEADRCEAAMRASWPAPPQLLVRTDARVAA